MKRIGLIIPLFLVILMALGTPVSAREKDGTVKVYKSSDLAQDGTYTNRTLVNVGQIAMWIYANAKSANQPNGNSGLAFPRGSSPSTEAIFQDGLVWGGEVNDGSEPIIRVGGGTYSDGLQPGKILGSRTGNVEPISDKQNVDRLWRVRRDYFTANLAQDAAEFFVTTAGAVSGSQIQQVRDIYAADWSDWPADRGAPFYDADGDGVYTPGFNSDGSPKLAPATGVTFDPAVHADEPGYAGADQVVWLVANDLDPGLTQALYGSPPIGIECQLTLWAYQRSDALGNIVFKQFRFIYKGTVTTPPNATITNMYSCQWSDPDVGDAGDDFAGSDVPLSLGFVYNSKVDNRYASAGFPPPASGYDFFAGPLVEDAAGEAIFGLKKRAGFSNLGMSTFGYFYAGGPDSDPDLNEGYQGTLQWWNLLRGFRPRPETPSTPWISPTGDTTVYVLTGDPVLGTGWTDSNPGDRRILLASGPFQMALDDTQETVVAVMAGLGSDRLSSVSVLKFIDRFAQDAFDNLFELPKAPALPVVAASELDGEIFLNWGASGADVVKTEDTVDKGYTFQGYNVYQFPSAGSSLDQGIKLATYDVVDGVRVISQETFDQSSGLVLNLPVQIGNDGGIVRTLTLTNDVIRDLPIVNGQTYYFGVTAYNYNADATIKTLESAPTIVTVVPQTTKPGVRLQGVAGDTLASVHEGASDGAVTVIITDPSKVTGDNYEVTFSVDATLGPVWHLTNTTTSQVLLANQTNQSGDSDYLVSEGFTAIVTGAPNSFKSFQVVANANGPLDPPEIGCFAFNDNGFPFLGEADRPTARQQSTGLGRWGIHTGMTGANNGSFAYFIERVTQGGARWPRIIPFDFEIRFTAASNFGYEPNAFVTGAGTGGTLINVPFELWNIGMNTPNDASDDYRLFPYLIDEAADGLFNLWASDHALSGGDNDPETDWFYWVLPEDTSPGQAGYNAIVNFIQTQGDNYAYLGDGTAGTDVFRRMVLVNWNGGSVSDPTFPANVTSAMPETGTVFRIITTKPNTPADKFTFSTTGYQPTVSAQTAKEDVLKLVNVYPNPYLGLNSFEPTEFSRFITFSHLPEKATIRIFNLAGVLVRTLEKDDPSQYTTWNLQNENGLPVAGGIYIANVEMPDLGASKNLKLAIIQEQQFLRRY